MNYTDNYTGLFVFFFLYAIKKILRSIKIIKLRGFSIRMIPSKLEIFAMLCFIITHKII